MGGCGGSGSKGHHILCDFYFFSPLRSTATFATEINKSPLPETSTHNPPTTTHRYSHVQIWNVSAMVCVCVCFRQTFGVCSFVISLSSFAFRLALAKLELNQTIAAGHLPLIKPFNFNHRHSMQRLFASQQTTMKSRQKNAKQAGKQTNNMAKYLP